MIGDDVEPGVERTDRWRGIGAATLLATAFGLVGRQPALVLVGAVGVALLAYARLVAPPPLELSVRRKIEHEGGDRAIDAGGDGTGANGSDHDGEGAFGGRGIDPDDRIAVTLEVENASDRTIPDLRLVDGVPAGLSVVEGTPRTGTTLRPGETVTCSYELSPRAGRHEFEPAAAIARDVAGVVERRDRIEADDETAFETEAEGDGRVDPPVRRRAARFLGTDRADATGAGVAFESVRNYRHGDPPGRIDWRRLARTGELSTVTYREERGRAVVLVVDARAAAAVAPAPEAPTAIERSLAAASGFVDRSTAEGHRVGIARLGPERTWIAPASGPSHERRVAELLAERSPTVVGDGDATDGERGDDAGEADAAAMAPDREWLREQLPPRAEVLMLSPCTDDGIVELARYVEATGPPVTVLSPDPTDDATPGRRLAGVERRRRLRSLRAAGVPVVDWPADASLDAVVREAAVEQPGVSR